MRLVRSAGANSRPRQDDEAPFGAAGILGEIVEKGKEKMLRNDIFVVMGGGGG